VAIQNVARIQKFEISLDGEVLGAAMLGLPACLKADEIMPLLERHGFAQIDPYKWYLQRNIINLYRDIEEGRSNVSENLVSIGIKSIETTQFPPDATTLKSGIMVIVGSYAQVHRNILPGEGTQVKFLSENHVHFIVNTPYPEDVFYGGYWGLLKKYVPQGTSFRIVQAENPYPDMPGIVYDATWG
jgi:hypothetical protein